ncbi:septation protein IspZ [Catellatospora tritici]|uniref:septation protein IspZ n=1 Tax=Catellatospora tritici TaxID=2851566 RepID=UPI001C2D4DA0|nr:septation protein IspZ [Catellatospora tritici]MBV1855058.1 septation protein IspZ [Catellatospora tritici]
MGGNAFRGFVPWIIFWVVAGPSTWVYAAGGAFVATLILLLPLRHHKPIKLVEIISAAFFGALTIAGLLLDPGQLEWLERYSQAISSGILALVVLGSLAFTPFTEQYAREQTPPEVRQRPIYKQVNRKLTLVWGLVFAACAVLGVLSQQMSSGRAWVNWILPIALIAGAYKFTMWYPQQVRAREHPAPAA